MKQRIEQLIYGGLILVYLMQYSCSGGTEPVAMTSPQEKKMLGNPCDMVMPCIYNKSGDIPKSIFEEDHRIEYHTASVEQQYNAYRIPAIIHRAHVEKIIDDQYHFKINGDTAFWEDKCECSRFYGQKRAAAMTAIPINGETAVTVDHEVNKGNYMNFYLVFGYYNIRPDQKEILVKREDIFEIIIAPENIGDNLTLLHLKGIDGQKINPKKIFKQKDFSTKVIPEAAIYNIGFSMGLPIKVTTDGIIKTDLPDHKFTIKIDMFNQSSGSPIFDKKTHQVIGLLNEDGCRKRAGHFREITFRNSIPCKVYCHGSCGGEIKAIKLTNLLPYLSKD